MGKVVLVTGGAGYVGSHTVQKLDSNGYTPIVIDNLTCGHRHIVEDLLKVPLVIGDIADEILMHQILKGNHPCTNGRRVDAVLHFAANAYVGESITNPAKYYFNNVANTIRMLNVILQISHESNNKPIPIVFSSSCATYGIPSKLPITEESLQLPINPYGRSKLMVEYALRDFSTAYKMSCIILRYFNAAGADPNGLLGELHEPETHLIPLAIKSALYDNHELLVHGDDYPTRDGTCIRDYVHVSDLADAHVSSLNLLLDAGEASETIFDSFNLGNGQGFTVKEILKEVESVTKKSVKAKISVRRPGDPPTLVASSNKALLMLGWKPKFGNINQIVQSAFNWEASHGSRTFLN